VVIITTGTPRSQILRANLAQKLQPVHGGHVDVGEDQVHRFALQYLQPLGAAAGLMHNQRSSPAWRSARSTILRITEESSTISARISLMPKPLHTLIYRRSGSILESDFGERFWSAIFESSPS
jgi:hypothetical protein